MEHERRSKALMSKFLLMGLTACTLAVMAQPIEQINTQESLQHIVKQSQAQDFLHGNISLKVHSKQQASQLPSEYYLDITKEGHCEINLTVQNDGDFKYVGSKAQEFKSIATPESKKEKELYKDFVALHEASHCEFSQIENPFIVKNNSELQTKVNYLYKDVGKHGFKSEKSVEVFDGVAGLLNETFADTYATMQMLKIHGATPDILSTMKKVQLQRHENGLHTRTMGTELHDTHFALHDVLKPQTLERIAHSSALELKQLALEIANDSVANVLVNSNVLANIGVESVSSGVATVVRNMLDKKDSDVLLASHSNLSLSSNTSNSFVFKLGAQVFNDIEAGKVDGYLGAKTEEAKGNVLLDYISEKVDSSEIFNSTAPAYRTYIRQNYKAQEKEQVDKNTSPEQLQDKLSGVKNEFVQKNGILANMQKIRERAYTQKSSLSL